MKEDLVSIVTPTYNCGKFITETIESVIGQTYKNWEMIIVDDCSKDNTQEIVKKYLKNDKRIKYIKFEKNQGAAIARNTAIREAKGRYIAFLDSDDLWSKDKLETYTNYEEIDENSKLLGIRVTGPKEITKKGMYNYCWPGCLTVMYNAEKIGLIQIKDIKKNNDYAMWLKICKKANCYLLDENLAMYRKRAGSISNHEYTLLIKWHYKLYREEEKQNIFFACFNTIRNIYFGIIKKLIYVKET